MPAASSIRILWLGSAFDEATMLASPAISPAANRWQVGLLGALKDVGADIHLLGHKPERAWPYGPPFIRGGWGLEHLSESTDKTPQRLLGYCNFPWLREQVLTRQYVLAFRHFLCHGLLPHCVLCYNVYPRSLAVAREAQRMGIPWVPVIADAPGDPAAYAHLERYISNASGCVFLSWSSYSRWQGEPKLHLDGGVAKVPERQLDSPATNGPKVVFYSGALDQYGGIELLLGAFALIQDPAVRLWICGKGGNNKMRQMLQTDSRITFFGCVSEEDLRGLSHQAWVMVNPRPTHEMDNRHNFPSKLLEYLSYGKPVVSTLTPGIAPEYAPLLSVPIEETPEALAQCLQDVLAWPLAKRAAHARAAGLFLAGRKTWQCQAARLDEFLRGIIRANAQT